MFPTARRTATALTVGAAAFALSGCSIPGLTGFAGGTPTVGPPASPGSAATGAPATPSEPTAAPSSRATRATTPASRAATPRPSSTPRPRPTPDSDDIENGYVPRASVEVRVAGLIREMVGTSALVECPGNLTARVGETMTCQAKLVGSADSTRRPVQVKVEEIQGRRVRYSAQLM